MASVDEVLVAFDGTPLSEKALAHALDVYSDASITVLHVIMNLLYRPPIKHSITALLAHRGRVLAIEWSALDLGGGRVLRINHQYPTDL